MGTAAPKHKEYLLIRLIKVDELFQFIVPLLFYQKMIWHQHLFHQPSPSFHLHHHNDDPICINTSAPSTHIYCNKLFIENDSIHLLITSPKPHHIIFISTSISFSMGLRPIEIDVKSNHHLFISSTHHR